MNVEDRINIYYQASTQLEPVFKDFNQYICKETLAKNILPIKHEGEKQQEFFYEIEQHQLKLYVKKQ